MGNVGSDDHFFVLCEVVKTIQYSVQMGEATWALVALDFMGV